MRSEQREHATVFIFSAAIPILQSISKAVVRIKESENLTNRNINL
jgi:hypothetical protein